MTRNRFSSCLRMAALAVTHIAILGGAHLYAQRTGGYSHPPAPVYSKEGGDKSASGDGSMDAFGASSPRSAQARVIIALRQGDAALHSSPPNYAEAEQSFRSATVVDRWDARGFYGLGYVYAAQKRYDDALEPYQRAVQLKPNMADAHFNLAIVYLRLNKKEDAVREQKILEKLKSSLAPIIERAINK